MTFDEALSKLVARNPDLTETARLVSELRVEGERLQLDPFFEPISVTIVEKKKRRLVVRAEHLASWTRHIASMTLCRAHCLEPAMVSNLVERNILGAMVLLRAHFEISALATYCLDQVTKSSRNNNVDTLEELILKTLFGTALKKHRDRDGFSEFVTTTEGDTIHISDAVAAMDSFYFQEGADGKLAVVYSLLCEYAHPNHRGVLDFMRAEELEGGWRISYRRDADQDSDMEKHALETLLVSMRSGYSAAEILRCWRFSSQRGDDIGWRQPSVDEADRIWVHLLQRPQG